MERKLASIQKIVSIEPIAGADAIEKATVLGWNVVVAKKDKLKAGDLVVYCEVDSIMPNRPEFEFLRERKFRIKTIKLKGQVSQGICFPLSILPPDRIRRFGFAEGDDLTEVLGVTKYDPQAEFERRETDRLVSLDKNRMTRFLKRYAWYRNLFFKRPTKTPFPSFIRKTDEDRIQLFPHYYENWQGLSFTITEKLDGQSATYFCIPNPKKGIFRKKWLFGVCSRNFQLLKPDTSSYWSLAISLDIEKKLRQACEEWGCGFIIQGEAIGRNIQGNKYKRNGYELYLFNVTEYYKGKYNPYSQVQQILFGEKYGFSTVPMLSHESPLLPTMAQMVESAKGKSAIADTLREGIVVRNYTQGVSFKVINPDFLLKYDA
jgi:hypothetical protein